MSSYTYANKKRPAEGVSNTETAQQPSIDALRAGAAAPTREQMGHRVDLPDAMREKMENAFGADLSAVKLYESAAVRDAGAEAVTQGSSIAFAPGMLDFTSYGGQALLGHEISHVVSQARGEVTGSGFLNDHALEARADREGAMAAAGQQIAAPTSAMSSVSAAPAAGPMQAMKLSNKVNRMKTINDQIILNDSAVSDEDKQWYDDQMSNMDERTMAEISRQQTKAAKGMVRSYKRKRGRGMDKGEAATRTHFSPASDDMQSYQSLLFNYGMQYDQTGGSFVAQLDRGLSDKDRAIRNKADRIAGNAVRNSFYDSQEGTDLRRNATAEREDRILDRYRRLR